MKIQLIGAAAVCLGLLTSTTLVEAQSWETAYPESFRKALATGTRSEEGRPGTDYWQNQADYFMNATFDPNSRLLQGEARVVYTNNSNDTLQELLLLLLPDLYKKGNKRDFHAAASDEHSGVRLFDLQVNAHAIDAARSGGTLTYYSTFAKIPLQSPILPHSTNTVEFGWEYILNAGSHMRTGQVDETSFFIAYWFPRIGVYDDITGWNEFHYSGTGEFYNDFGNFDVELTVPGNYIVWATGELQNPQSTFAPPVLERYRQAQHTDSPVTIIGQQDIASKQLTVEADWLVWKWSARQVSDFAFALSDHYIWEACTFNPGSAGKPVFLSTAYNPRSPDFPAVLNIARKSMDYMAVNLPGEPFPYPAMTIFNGLDEMEYPMLVNDHSLENLDETFSLTAHEVCHTYFPFLTGCNETEYAWMDEGLTSFFEYNIIRDIQDSSRISIYFLDNYLELAGTTKDRPLITPSPGMKGETYYAISYAKAAGFYQSLVQECGRAPFKKALREFVNRWSGKHPTGYDFFNTLQSSLPIDPAPLIDAWFYKEGFVDLFFSGIEHSGSTYSLQVGNRGHLPVGFSLKATLASGNTAVYTFKPSIWYPDVSLCTLQLHSLEEIVSLELVEDIPLDVNPGNNHLIP